MRNLRLLPAVLTAALCAACATPQRIPLAKSPALKYHFAQGRVVDVTLVRKQVGTKKGLLGAKPLYREFLEGYIEGTLATWDGEPAQGAVVRAAWGEAAVPSQALTVEEEEALADESLSDESDETPPIKDAVIDEAVSDKNGNYRLRFSIPVLQGKIELTGKITYCPGWKDQLDKLGRAYEPWVEEIPMEIYYYKKQGLLAYSEGKRKSIVQMKGQKAAAATSEKKAVPQNQKAKHDALILDLQILLVTNHLEKTVLLKRSSNAIHLELAENTLFAPESDELLPETRASLSPLVKWLGAQNGAVKLEAPKAADKELSQRRASSLRSFLQDQGVDPQRISALPESSMPNIRISLLL